MTETRVTETLLEHVIALRHELHRFPELSGKEDTTIQRLKGFFHPLHSGNFFEHVGGNSIAWTFGPANPDKTILFRADMDALPISDEIDAGYRSENQKAGHKCGHDGHMSILAGFAATLDRHPPERTRVVVLFQAEEETGRGAEKVVNDPWYKEINADYVFGLHNLPGFTEKEVIVREKIFASASEGMMIKLTGKSSHAGQPQDGRSPAMVISRLTRFIQEELDYTVFEHFCLATIIHIRLGEIAFGTSPGDADYMITLRASKDEELALLREMITDKTREICEEEAIQYEIGYTECFPSTVNHPEMSEIVERAAGMSNLNIRKPAEPFRWSEDFGHYLKHTPGAFFGLGAGKKVPALHNPDYDFPDAIIGSGIDLFFNIFSLIDKK